MNMNEPIFYHKKPVFGLDIGTQAVKMMQLEVKGKKAQVRAYGSVETDEKIMKDGVISNIAGAARMIDDLLANNLHGHLNTNRVVMSLPVSSAYTRVITLPQLSKKELADAIQLEIEQSVPVPSKNLYYDYEITQTEDASTMLVRTVAVPKDIIDSYIAVCDLLNLDLTLVQTNIRADAQLCMLYEDIDKNEPYIILDVGGSTTDIGIIDNTLRLTGTVDAGGNNLTDAIAKKLKVSNDKAHGIKITKGLGVGPQQEKIKSVIEPIMQKIIKEIERMIRFYEERIHPGSHISQILIVGGGANMPGFGDYLTDKTRIATRLSSPWNDHISFGKMEPPEAVDLPRYLTCAGSAIAADREVF